MQANEILTAVLASASQGIVVLDAVGRPLSISPAAARMLGLPPGTLPARIGPLEVVPLQAVLAGASVRVSELRVEPGEGEEGILELLAEPVPGPDGAALGVAVWLYDVTARLRAEAKQREAEASFRAYLEHSPEALVLHRPRQGVLFINPAGSRLLGYPDPSEIIGVSAGALIHPEDRPLVARRIAAMVQRREAMPTVEERVLRRDGSAFPALVTAMPITYEGEFTILVLASDLTERKRAEAEREALRQLAERRAAELESVLHNMADGVLACDGEGRLTLLNDAAAALFGLAPTALGADVAAVLRSGRVRSPDGRPLEREELPVVRALGGESSVLNELAIATNGRDRFIRTNATPLKSEGGRVLGAVEVARDVTELTELDRLKDEFMSVAAHELKTPVTVVKGYAQALRRSCQPLSLETEPLLAAIDRGAERIASIVRDLVEVSQIQLGRLQVRVEDAELLPVATRVVERYARLVEPGGLVLSGPAELRAACDPELLGRVLSLVVDNAVRFSPSRKDLRVELRPEADGALVEVRDRGIGVPADRLPHLFERFYRAHTDTPLDPGGMGVGLFLAREIVRRMGGTITLESEEGRGTTVRLHLPRAARGAPRG